MCVGKNRKKRDLSVRGFLINHIINGSLPITGLKSIHPHLLMIISSVDKPTAQSVRHLANTKQVNRTFARFCGFVKVLISGR